MRRHRCSRVCSQPLTPRSARAGGGWLTAPSPTRRCCEVSTKQSVRAWRDRSRQHAGEPAGHLHAQQLPLCMHSPLKVELSWVVLQRNTDTAGCSGKLVYKCDMCSLEGVGAASLDLLARLALPDAHGGALHVVLQQTQHLWSACVPLSCPVQPFLDKAIATSAAATAAAAAAAHATKLLPPALLPMP